MSEHTLPPQQEKLAAIASPIQGCSKMGWEKDQSFCCSVWDENKNLDKRTSIEINTVAMCLENTWSGCFSALHTCTNTYCFFDGIQVTPRTVTQRVGERGSMKTRQSLQTHPNKQEVLPGYLIVASSPFSSFYKWSHTSQPFEVITTYLILSKQISAGWDRDLPGMSLLQHCEVCHCWYS